MKISSHRHLNRMRRLGELITEAGSASALAVRIATPKSHISALMSGARGMGDELASKLERKMEKVPGWMDLPADASGVLVAREDASPYGPETIDISETDWAMLEVFQAFPPSRRRKIVERLQEESTEFREMADEAIKHLTTSGQVHPIEPAIKRKPSQPPAKRVRVKADRSSE